MEQQNYVNEDEISLLDIFVVLLKYRRLIILSSLAAVILSVALYLFYPQYKINAFEKNHKTEARASIVLSAFFDDSLAQTNSYISRILNNPENIYTALKIAGYDKIKDIDLSQGDSKTYFALEKLFVKNESLEGKKLKAEDKIYSGSIDKDSFLISFRSEDNQKAQNFVESIIRILEEKLLAYAQPLAEQKISAFSLIINKSKDLDSDFAKIGEAYIKAKDIVEGKNPSLLNIQSINILEEDLSIESVRKSTVKKAVILVFAVFFMSIFAAFILNAIDNIKKDEEAMKKIKEALKKG